MTFLNCFVCVCVCACVWIPLPQGVLVPVPCAPAAPAPPLAGRHTVQAAPCQCQQRGGQPAHQDRLLLVQERPEAVVHAGQPGPEPRGPPAAQQPRYAPLAQGTFRSIYGNVPDLGPVHTEPI